MAREAALELSCSRYSERMEKIFNLITTFKPY